MRLFSQYSQKQEEFYHDAMRKTVQEGGDTDTNACIAGGMVGALVGLGQIPEYMKNKLLSFDCEKPENGIPRPNFLSVREHGIQNMERLIELAQRSNIIMTEK